MSKYAVDKTRVSYPASSKGTQVSHKDIDS